MDRIDALLVAQGKLPDQRDCEASLERTLQAIRTNALSVIAAIGAVAGDRKRQSN